MEIGAFFILLIVLGVVVVLGGLLYAITWRLRRAKLDPHEDRLAGEADRQPERPQHRRVASEQRTRFLTHR